MSSQLPFAPASPAKFVAWLKTNDACAEAVAWVGKRSALEALAALEPTTQHVEWSCWVADRVLPVDTQRRLHVALLRTMPEYLVAIPAVAEVIKMLEAEPFDPDRLKAAGMQAWKASRQAWAAARAAEEGMISAWRAAWRAAEAAAVASWAARTCMAARAAEPTWTTSWVAVAKAAKAVAEAAEATGMDAEDVLRQQLAVLTAALAKCLKVLTS